MGSSCISYWVLATSAEGKTPKYTLRHYRGKSPLFEQRGKDNKVSLYLKKNIAGINAPTMNLQGKNGLNITGLRAYSGESWKPGFMAAYGEADQRARIPQKGGEPKQNYMYPHRADAFVFIFEECIMHQPSGLQLPKGFYFLIAPQARLESRNMCLAASRGVFGDTIKEFEQAVREYEARKIALSPPTKLAEMFGT